MIRKPSHRTSSAAALAEPPEPKAATGRYPAPVWSQAAGARPFATTEPSIPDAPSATGRYPRPVWSQAATAAGLGAPDDTLRAKEAGYTDEIGDAADAETPPRSAAAELDNRSIYRIVREVTVPDSGDDLYAATAHQDAEGLCFGLALFTQASGHLGAVLRLMQTRDAAAFRAIFGDQTDALVSVTTAGTPAERLAAVGGDLLWSDAWMQRFRQAGANPAFQAAQNEQAIEGLFRPMLRYAAELGIDTDRSLAMLFDRVVTRGVGGAMRWAIQACGPLRTEEQRMSALEVIGFEDLKDFQRSTGWVRPTGVFGPDTHAALVGALRRAGETLLPSAEDYMGRLLRAAAGAARTRLARLRDSDKFEDVVYRLEPA